MQLSRPFNGILIWEFSLIKKKERKFILSINIKTMRSTTQILYRYCYTFVH